MNTDTFYIIKSNNDAEFSLELPPKSAATSPEEVKNAGVVVVVGANGSGKTRLGSWIDIHSKHKERAHRVSAQKSLAFPESITSASVDKALLDLLWGNENAHNLDWKRDSRWSRKPETHLLDDYTKLLRYLYSEHNEVANAFYERANASSERILPPITKLVRAQQIWEELLPHRKLLRGGGKMEAKSSRGRCL